MKRKRQRMWVDQEFFELYKNSGYPSPFFTKKVAMELKSKKKKKDEIDEGFKI